MTVFRRGIKRALRLGKEALSAALTRPPPEDSQLGRFLPTFYNRQSGGTRTTILCAPCNAALSWDHGSAHWVCPNCGSELGVEGACEMYDHAASVLTQTSTALRDSLDTLPPPTPQQHPHPEEFNHGQ
jgi:predicted RNA-binding Zn-ribbon protein involved in translation (DUF1610 family)